MSPSLENHLETATRALQAYNVEPATLSFLQHSENPAFGNHGENKAAVNSEMLWLLALRRARFPVPPPVQTRDGEFVAQVDGINTTLLKWQNGEILTRDMETEQTAAQIGTLVGKLHQFSRQWKLPKGFTRPLRDSSYFEKAMLALWLIAW
jgi:Ser/Thr protein kinase RdoA (MazF antagonist)